MAVVSSTSEALLQGTADAGANGNVSIKAKNLTTLDSVSDGFALDEGLPAGVGAAIAITVADIHTKAGVYENATISQSTGIGIAAQTSGNVSTSAESSVGGASDAISDALHVEDDGGDDVLTGTLIAEINALIDNIAEGISDAVSGEGGGSALQIAGAFTYSDVDSTSEASIVTAGLVVTVGGLTITSQGILNASSLASGMTSGGTAGVGAGVAVLSARNTNKAYIGDGVQVRAHGVSISALSEDFRDDVDDEANDFSVEAYAGQGADTVGISGALAVNIVQSDTAAYIGKNAGVTLTGGNASINATNNTNVKTIANGAPDDDDKTIVDNLFALYNAVAGGEGGGEEEEGAKVGVGSAIAITISTIKTLSFIDDGAIITGANDITIRAAADTTTETQAISGSEGGVCIVPVLALDVSAVQTEAYTGTGGLLLLGGSFLAEATHGGSNDTSSSGKAAGADVGIGAAVTISVVTERTRSRVNRNISAGGTVTVRAQGATSSRGARRGGRDRRRR